MSRTIKHQRELRRIRRKIVLDLLGNSCVECGTIKNLHFDHIDPKTKKYNIAGILTSSIEVIINEVKKCQLLCNSCHGKKSAKDGTHKIGINSGTHGSIYFYTNHKCRCAECKNTWKIYWHNYHKRSKVLV